MWMRKLNILKRFVEGIWAFIRKWEKSDMKDKIMRTGDI